MKSPKTGNLPLLLFPCANPQERQAQAQGHARAQTGRTRYRQAAIKARSDRLHADLHGIAVVLLLIVLVGQPSVRD